MKRKAIIKSKKFKRKAHGVIDELNPLKRRGRKRPQDNDGEGRLTTESKKSYRKIVEDYLLKEAQYVIEKRLDGVEKVVDRAIQKIVNLYKSKYITVKHKKINLKDFKVIMLKKEFKNWRLILSSLDLEAAGIKFKEPYLIFEKVKINGKKP